MSMYLWVVSDLLRLSLFLSVNEVSCPLALSSAEESIRVRNGQEFTEIVKPAISH